MLRYKCLVLDHDDTVVKSTQQINYPAFIDALKRVRPNMNMSLDEYISYNFDPGFLSLCYDIVKFNKEEMDLQDKIWFEHENKCVPDFFEGLKEIFEDYKAQGGILCVVSHSYERIINRDYEKNYAVLPDICFGWDYEEEKRKPNPYPLEEIMRLYNLQPQDLLMVDDLKPGYDMAKKCDVDFAYAGWTYTIPQIKEFMDKYSDYYFHSTEELRNLLFIRE